MMKCRIKRAALANAVNAVKLVVAKDAASPFGFVRLAVAGENLSVTATNGEMQISYRVACDDAVDGDLVLRGLQFVKFCSALPDDDVSVSGKNESSTVISCAGVSYKFAACEILPYDQIVGPEPDDGVLFEVGAEHFVDMLGKTSFAVCADDTRAILCGVNFCFKDGTLGLTATDGRRLSHMEFDCGDVGGAFDVTLSPRVVGVIKGIMREGGMATVRCDGKSMMITGRSFCLTAKVIDGVYPNWRRVMPGEMECDARINRAMFLAALSRVALSANETGHVKIDIGSGQCAFSAKNAFSVASETMTGCVLTGEPVELHVNASLLIEALESIDSDEFTLRRAKNGGVIELRCDLPWVSVVMPLRCS